MSQIGKYQLLVFDWEGTICDTLGYVIAVLRAEAEKIEGSVFDELVVREALHSGLPWAIKKTFPMLSSSQQVTLMARTQQALGCYHRHRTALMRGAFSFIKASYERGVYLAIASNKNESGLRQALEETGLAPFFHAVRSASSFPLKPAPDMLLDILSSLQVTLDSAVMIGDSVSDIEMARVIGMDALGMTTSQAEKDVLKEAGALSVVENYALLSYFFQLQEGGAL